MLCRIILDEAARDVVFMFCPVNAQMVCSLLICWSYSTQYLGAKAGIVWEALNQNGSSIIGNLVKTTSLSREKVYGDLLEHLPLSPGLSFLLLLFRSAIHVGIPGSIKDYETSLAPSIAFI